MGEAFGMVLIEAMACGKPVIASNLPGVRSVVNDGEDGLLVEPGNVADLAAKIRQLLDDPQRRQEMGKRGRAKVERKYAWDAIGAKLEQTYYEVLNRAA
jgi:glycosyltransferase involved in cell wall biosynthesis